MSRYSCSDRMCGALDCENCYPGCSTPCEGCGVPAYIECECVECVSCGDLVSEYDEFALEADNKTMCEVCVLKNIPDIVRKIVDKMRPDELDTIVYNHLVASVSEDILVLPRLVKAWEVKFE